MSSQNIQERKSDRKMLKTVQYTSFDTENIVGRPSKSLKKQLSQESPRSPATVVQDETKKKILQQNKETQATPSNVITVEDLTSAEEPSEKYWQILAVKRQITIQEVMSENERLRKTIEDLKEELSQYKQMLDEANSFVEVFKEELANCSKDDTGIDVNDVSSYSTADEQGDHDKQEIKDLEASKSQE